MEAFVGQLQREGGVVAGAFCLVHVRDVADSVVPLSRTLPVDAVARTSRSCVRRPGRGCSTLSYMTLRSMPTPTTGAPVMVGGRGSARRWIVPYTTWRPTPSTTTGATTIRDGTLLAPEPPGQRRRRRSGGGEGRSGTCQTLPAAPPLDDLNELGVGINPAPVATLVSPRCLRCRVRNHWPTRVVAGDLAARSGSPARRDAARGACAWVSSVELVSTAQPGGRVGAGTDRRDRNRARGCLDWLEAVFASTGADPAN